MLPIDPVPPTQGKLTAEIASVTNNLITELSRGTNGATIQQSLEMVRFNPILGTAADTFALMAVLAFGEYSHEDEEIEAWVRSNFANMSGSFPKAIAQQSSAKFFRYAVSEWYVMQDAGQWWLDGIHILNPKHYRFRAKDRLLYDVLEQSGSVDVPLPMPQVLFVENTPYLSFGDPTDSVSVCDRAYPIYQAWKVVISEMLVAAQRQATPILVGQSDASDRIELTDSQGNPLLRDGVPVTIPAPQHLLNQMADLDNRSVISTDLKSKIQSIANQSDGRFFIECLEYLQRLMLLTFSFPETIFQVGQGGLGNAGLNQGHMEVLHLSIEGLVSQIREEVIEKIVRSLITWNFGEQDSYGEFVPQEADVEDRISLFSALSDAIAKGAFSVADLAVINRMRDLSGIPRVEEIEMPEIDQLTLNYFREA